MITKSERSGAAHLVALNEKLDVHSTPDFLDHVGSLQKDGVWNFVIDLTELVFISSYGLGALATIQRNCQAKGGAVKLVGLTPPIRTPFEITGLIGKFEVFDTAEAATGSF